MDEPRLDEVISRYQHIDVERDAIAEVLRQIIEACDSAENDNWLCWIGTSLVEVFLDVRDEPAWVVFEEGMRSNQRLRMAYTCADVHIPDDVVARLDALVDPDNEDIGGSQPGRFGCA